MRYPTYPLLTQRLALRPYADGDLDAFAEMQRRPDVVRYLYWDVMGRDEAAALLEKRTTRVRLEDEGDALILAVTLRESDVLIGDVVLGLRSQEHRQGELGFIFHPDHQGQGYAREASVELLRLGFEERGLHRIVGRCDARNAPSARLMERLGMRREAHLRENEWVKGEWTDELVYAMLAAEWAAARSAPGAGGA